MPRKRPVFDKNQIQEMLAGLYFADGVEDAIVAVHEDYKDDPKFWGEIFFRFFFEQNLNRHYRPLGPVASPSAGRQDDETRSGVDFVRDAFGALAGEEVRFTPKTGRSVSARLVICVDADSRYLYETPWYTARSYVFHTYAYSIESYNCYGNWLNKELEKFSLGRYPLIHFPQLLEEVSRVIAPLFCHWIYAHRSHPDMLRHAGKEAQKQVLNMEGFCKQLVQDEVQPADAQQKILAELARRVGEAVEVIEAHHGPCLDAQAMDEMQAGIADQHDIQPSELHLYLKGHWIFGQFLLPVLAYQFWQLRNCFWEEKGADAARRKQVSSQFGSTEAEASDIIGLIAATCYRDIIARHEKPVDKILKDLQRHSWL